MAVRTLVSGGWIAGLVVGLASCGESTSRTAPREAAPATPVHVESVQTRRVTRSLVLPGIVEAERRIELAFRTSGFIARFHVEEGERVESGQVIAELDLADLEREVQIARAALRRAEAHEADTRLLFERQEGMRRSKATSQQSHDQARLALQAARAEVAHTRLLLESRQDQRAKGTLRAPTAGYIERRLVEEYEFSQSGRPVVVLSDLDRVKVRAAVSDAALSRVRIGSPARIRSPSWTDRVLVGTISSIDVAADRKTHTIPFEVTLSNPDLALRPEQVVEVEIEAGSESVLGVPLGAVLRDAQKRPFCFVVVPEGEAWIAQRREVEVGAMHGQRLTILSGLSEGERIVVRGQQFLRAGDPVAVLAD